MTAEPAQFIPGPHGTFYPANRAAIDLAKARKKLALNAADLVEIKQTGTSVTLMNGQPIVTEAMA